ncbi:MAG: hypothetical protein WBB69_12975 [Anaerolineales bacterium]
MDDYQFGEMIKGINITNTLLGSIKDDTRFIANVVRAVIVLWILAMMATILFALGSCSAIINLVKSL